jgi:hypothetical protein
MFTPVPFTHSRCRLNPVLHEPRIETNREWTRMDANGLLSMNRPGPSCRPAMRRGSAVLPTRFLVPMRLALRFGLVAVAFFAFKTPAAIPSPEKLLPQDTLVMLTAPDFSKLRAVWSNCPAAKLWNDPAMKPFRDKCLSQWNAEFAQPLERELGVRFDDYNRLPQGQVTLALTQNGWNGSGAAQPSLLVLVDAKDKQEQLKKSLTELRKKWVDAGKSLRTEKIRGVDFSIVPLASQDIPKTLQKAFGQADAADPAGSDPSAASGRELTVGQFDSLLIAADSTRVVEQVMVHLTGGAMPCLGDLAAYEANRLALFRNAPVYGWANVKLLLDVLNRSASQNSDDDDMPDPMPALNPGKMITAIGLGGLKTFAFNFESSDSGSLVNVFVGVPESGRQGILKLFPGHGKESSPPPFVPADVVKFRRYRVDGQQGWATLRKVMGDINPRLLTGLDFFIDTANAAAKEKDPSFDIQQNLFGNLGDDFITYQQPPRDKSATGDQALRSLILIGSPRPEQLASALKSVGTLWSRGDPLPEREFLGRKIFSVPLPGVTLGASDPTQGSGRGLNCAATASYVALSTDAAMLEEYLRSSENPQKALRDRPGLVDATSKVGGTSTGWFGYDNQAEASRAMFDQLRKISTVDTNSAVPAPFQDATGPFAPRKGFKDWLDFSLLPPYDKVARYFSFSVYAASAGPEGLSFKWFSPTPPALRR